MGGCLSIRIRENVMKCINVECEGKTAYDIVIDTEEKRGYRESGVANREIFKFPGSYHGYF